MKPVLLFASFLLIQLCEAQWNGQSSVNTPVAVAADIQYVTLAVTDGSGGTIICWNDWRNGTGDIYVQRLNAAGVPQWTPNGVAVTNIAGNQTSPKIAEDGNGGAFIAWGDNTSGTNDIYAQRVNASGNLLWTAAGKPVVVAAGEQYLSDIKRMGTDSLVVAWGDNRVSTQTDAYAQLFDGSGNNLWTANGLLLSNAVKEQTNPQIFFNAPGSIVITWLDYRNNNHDTYAQRLLANGTIQWTANGIPLASGPDWQANMQLVTDGSDGFLAVWEDGRNGFLNTDFYAQRFNVNGVAQWTAGGVPVTNAPASQAAPRAIVDGFGGFIVVWHDLRNGTTRDLYAQRISGSGAALWTANGLAVCLSPGHQTNPQIITDGGTGAFVSWYDQRSGNNDIYAQKLTTSGGTEWTTNGVVVSDAPNNQEQPVMVSTAAGGTIVAWTDSRTDAGDIYAALLYTNGALPVKWLSFDGSPSANGNELVWKTAAENDNDYFEIQKSTGGDFKKLGIVKSNGNTNQVSTYTFTDILPSGDDLYRIRQVNKDGSYSLSKSIRIINKSAVRIEFENPVRHSMKVSTRLRGELTITDMEGKVRQRLQVTAQETVIYTANLAAGTYILTLAGNTRTFVRL